MKHHHQGTDTIEEAQLVPDIRQIHPQQPLEGGGLNLHDLLFALFRHKWKIILLGLLGLGAAAYVYLNRTPLYESQAKLFVPYVLDRNTPGEGGSQVTSASGYAGRSVLNVEMDLLTSWDLIETVAQSVGVTEVLPGATKETPVSEAAAAILGNLKVLVPPDSMVINVNYQHTDPAKARTILGKLVNEYLIKHKETHRSSRSLAYVDGKASDAKTNLETARKELEQLKKDQNIISLANREAALSKQQAAIEEELLSTEAKKAEQKVRVRFAEAMSPEPKGKEKTGTPDETTVLPALPANRDIEEYRGLVEQIESLKRRRNELRLTYTDSNGQIRTVQSQLDAAEAKRQVLLTKYPAFGAPTVKGVDGGPLATLDPRAERETLNAIEARLQFLTNESLKLKAELTTLLGAGTSIAKLERDIQEYDANYRYYNTALERARVDQNLKPSELENISVIQQPSVPSLATSAAVRKLAMGLAFSGFGLGIAIAFLIELFLDRSIKRPQEFESKLQLPLMLSIPFLTDSRRPQLRLNGAPAGMAVNGAGATMGVPETSQALARNTAVPTPWEAAHFIRPFADAVRDRIGYHFHINGITHKPKLIGLTGFSDGAGTSTLAAALAASFAEMTDGKILYVNLNGGAPLPETEGAPSRPGIDVKESTKEAFGLVENQDNLFVASITPGKARNGLQDGTGPGGYQTFVPKQLFELMPRLRASDFEYVIFDMPPLAPTSPTLSIAGFMDKVLLVVDAGKTNRDVVRRSYQELAAKGNADVSTILNKTRESLPSWLQG
ncbi:MAG: Wzz/FepE/Etk N-terminal domain-containing protein [Verrucomicrobiota bacterium]